MKNRSLAAWNLLSFMLHEQDRIGKRKGGKEITVSCVYSRSVVCV